MVAPFAIMVFPALGIFKIPESKPNVFEPFGFLAVNNSGVLVIGSIIEDVLLKKLFAWRITVPALFVALTLFPFSSK